MNIALRFIDLCLFKAGPADLPASDSLLKLSLLVYLVLAIIANHLDSEWTMSLFVSLADVLFLILAVAVLLKFRAYQSRYIQTVTALAGSGSCLALIALPIMWWFHQIEAEQQATSYAMLLMLVLIFWSLMVMAHIFRQSLEIKAGTAALLTIVYTLMTLIISGLVMSGVA